MRATMTSRGRICVEDLDGNELENDEFLDKIKNPNFSQSQDDFLYQHSFFKGTGNNITRVIHRGKSKTVDSVISFENLIPDQIHYNEVNKVNKFVFTNGDIKDTKSQHIKYRLDDKDIPIPLDELLFFYDISNGLTSDSRFKSPSRIESLMPALKNIEEAQKAKNINLNFSSKYIASGKSIQNKNDFNQTILGSKEKEEIENILYSKDIHAIANGLEVHNLSNDFTKLLYDDSIAASMLKVSNAYGMSKDVINYALNGASTHENQKTAIVDWIQNSIQFEANDWANTYNDYFKYPEQGKKIVVKYDHLPVMQILEEKRMAAMKMKIEIAQGLTELGVSQKDALKQVGL